MELLATRVAAVRLGNLGWSVPLTRITKVIGAMVSWAKRARLP